MTEEEARTKWCPMVRDTLIQEKGIVAELRPGINSNNGDREKYCCIASDCMLWIRKEKLENGWVGHCGLIK